MDHRNQQGIQDNRGLCCHILRVCDVQAWAASSHSLVQCSPVCLHSLPRQGEFGRLARWRCRVLCFQGGVNRRAWSSLSLVLLRRFYEILTIEHFCRTWRINMWAFFEVFSFEVTDIQFRYKSILAFWYSWSVPTLFLPPLQPSATVKFEWDPKIIRCDLFFRRWYWCDNGGWTGALMCWNLGVKMIWLVLAKWCRSTVSFYFWVPPRCSDPS